MSRSFHNLVSVQIQTIQSVGGINTSRNNWSKQVTPESKAEQKKQEDATPALWLIGSTVCASYVDPPCAPYIHLHLGTLFATNNRKKNVVIWYQTSSKRRRGKRENYQGARIRPNKEAKIKGEHKAFIPHGLDKHRQTKQNNNQTATCYMSLYMYVAFLQLMLPPTNYGILHKVDAWGVTEKRNKSCLSIGQQSANSFFGERDKSQERHYLSRFCKKQRRERKQYETWKAIN